MNTAEASYKELREYIKAEKAKSQEAKDFFGDYTHETTEGLRDLVEGYQDTFGTQDEEVHTEAQSVDNELVEVVSLLQKALDLLKSKGGYVDNSELEELHRKAMEIEFELENSVN